MAKVAEDAVVAELPLNDERAVVKRGRHVTIALNHLNKQRDKLVVKELDVVRQIKELDAAIAALE